MIRMPTTTTLISQADIDARIRTLADEIEADYPGDDGLFYHEGAPFPGAASHVEGHRIASEDEYRDGLLWGVSRTWHPTGEPESEATCLAGLLHGVRCEWDAAGRLVGHEVLEYGVCLWRRRWNGAGELIEDFRLNKSRQ